MTRVQIRYFVVRPAGRMVGPRHYWAPSKALRDAGWRLRRLPDDLNAAIAEASRINALLDRWKAGAPVPELGALDLAAPRRKPALVSPYRRNVTAPAFDGWPGPAPVIEPSNGRQGVYLMLRSDGVVKIGISRAPFKRLATFSSNSPDRLRLVRFHHVAEPLKVERDLHARFAQAKVAGEWFHIAIADAVGALEELLMNRGSSSADESPDEQVPRIAR